jgi:nicotinamide phosphoribosyltransferase
MWGTELKELVLGREGVLVVRPDSGDPATTALQCLEILGEKIGMETNSKGYKMLDPHVRMIWGDGIDYESLQEILATITGAGWSSDNMAFGSGGGLLQKLNRDTQKCAFKCAMAVVDGEEREVFKDPITDPGKKSKKGRLSIHPQEGGSGWVTKMGPDADEASSAIQPVYENGVLLSDCTWAEVTGRAAIASPSPYVVPDAPGAAEA